MSTYSRWRPHPWHGLSVGPDAPKVVQAYIEGTPFDSVKYEVDKDTGYIKVDRSFKFASQLPCLYGLVPRTYCGERVQKLSPKSSVGDGDPLDICVLCERPVSRGDIILDARVIGGIRMIDDGEADDKIIAVLANDPFWNDVQDLGDLSSVTFDRIRHYFLNYKTKPEQEPSVSFDGVYGKEEAYEVIRASMEDYEQLISTMTEEA